MIRTIQYSFPSKADGLEISCLAVVPELGRDEKYRGIIQIVHGMSEYKERYLPFMEYMAERKYVSVIHDHRGHGKSVRSKEDLGYMYGGGADAMLQDIHTVNCLIRDHFPELPLILFGHSMGSLAVRAYAAHHDGCMDMLIVCGSPSYNVLRPVGVVLAKAEKTVFGPKHSAGLIEMMSFGSYAMRFKKEKNRFSWICSDPQVVKDYSDSEYCGFTFTDDAYLALFDLMKRAYDVKHWKCTKPEMPVLFISGAVHNISTVILRNAHINDLSYHNRNHKIEYHFQQFKKRCQDTFPAVWSQKFLKTLHFFHSIPFSIR